jgi:hypothetical protein
MIPAYPPDHDALRRNGCPVQKLGQLQKCFVSTIVPRGRCSVGQPKRGPNGREAVIYRRIPSPRSPCPWESRPNLLLKLGQAT